MRLTSEIYAEIANRLRDRIGRSNYFSGSVTFTAGDIDYRLTASLIIHRKEVEMPDGRFDTITDAVPVWCEFHTSRNGRKRVNDFDFATLKEFLL